MMNDEDEAEEKAKAERAYSFASGATVPAIWNMRPGATGETIAPAYGTACTNIRHTNND